MLSLILAVAGGLVSYPQRTLGPELVANGSFASLSGWTHNGFVADPGVGHDGAGSMRMTDANLLPRSQAANHSIAARSGGRYRAEAWVKVENLGANQSGSGVRLCVAANEGPGQAHGANGVYCSKVLSGTSDWTKLEVPDGLIVEARYGVSVKVGIYREPSGTVWIDDVSVRELVPPAVEAVMRFPNWRGVLWSDQQTAVFDVKRNAPGAITANVFSEGGAPSGTPLAVEEGRVRIDLSKVPGDTLRVRFAKDGQQAFPDFRIVRKHASERDRMALTFTPDGRFLRQGKPLFILGAYDAGLGYPSTTAKWEAGLTRERRLFELQGLNAYLNYWYGKTPLTSLNPLMDTLRAHGISYFSTANCFGPKLADGFAALAEDPAYATELGRHAGLAGWYTADECDLALSSVVFPEYQKLLARDPDGATLAVLNYTAGLESWLPSADILATDPYPIYGSEPYPWAKVYDSALATSSIADGRPTITVIQYYKMSAGARWPTTEDLRRMSWAAVAGGSDGLFYWSLGVKALAWVCPDWCDQKVELFDRLKTVVRELSSAQWLAGPDVPAPPASDPLVKTRAKRWEGVTHVIAYNHSAQARTALVGGKSLSFNPWETRVFETGGANPEK